MKQALLALLLVTGCLDDDAPPQVCTPKETRSCRCEGSGYPGTEVCSNDGQEWGTCGSCMRPTN